ncbi:hypothetical protein SPRG_11823 [Saprolegnia parasitica CBS 223.65]|uniref:WW domain-containing protein n=1 Tax=Saprolegnia parasitica (strain CBS 223.65) TaxID=695850 RepID=A0A067C8T9_SAPPC|nr:hypothetical protein SPRG_11823 [Saprolegnia parasitica CBS 223.65]KDO22976.1 hypothetical protein SPRG_11823 [Saprolegnia parasitica CBS 223.65]|eukprot:XP_012206267.1 hypothetical protein SPRG_11823 [Saprolegnia parasitica CBS 223.65]
MAEKRGLWTEHVDAATGRTFYYNVAYGRSFWTLPDDCSVVRPRQAPTEPDDDAMDTISKEATSLTERIKLALEKKAQASTTEPAA